MKDMQRRSESEREREIFIGEKKKVWKKKHSWITISIVLKYKELWGKRNQKMYLYKYYCYRSTMIQRQQEYRLVSHFISSFLFTNWQIIALSIACLPFYRVEGLWYTIGWVGGLKSGREICVLSSDNSQTDKKKYIWKPLLYSHTDLHVYSY